MFRKHFIVHTFNRPCFLRNHIIYMYISILVSSTNLWVLDNFLSNAMVAWRVFIEIFFRVVCCKVYHLNDFDWNIHMQTSGILDLDLSLRIPRYRQARTYLLCLGRGAALAFCFTGIFKCRMMSQNVGYVLFITFFWKQSLGLLEVHIDILNLIFGRRTMREPCFFLEILQWLEHQWSSILQLPCWELLKLGLLRTKATIFWHLDSPWAFLFAACGRWLDSCHMEFESTCGCRNDT